eukprot:gene3225-8374_t
MEEFIRRLTRANTEGHDLVTGGDAGVKDGIVTVGLAARIKDGQRLVDEVGTGFRVAGPPVSAYGECRAMEYLSIALFAAARPEGSVHASACSDSLPNVNAVNDILVANVTDLALVNERADHEATQVRKLRACVVENPALRKPSAWYLHVTLKGDGVEAERGVNAVLRKRGDLRSRRVVNSELAVAKGWERRQRVMLGMISVDMYAQIRGKVRGAQARHAEGQLRRARVALMRRAASMAMHFVKECQMRANDGVSYQPTYGNDVS